MTLTRAVVTGAAGFVGSRLAEHLVGSGVDVVGIDAFTDYYEPARKRSNLTRLAEEARFMLHEGDLRDVALAPLLEGADAVFHLAAQPGVRSSWAEGFVDYVEHNVRATQRLLEAVRLQPTPPRVVLASSSSVYGRAPAYPTHEGDREAPNAPYGVTKLAAEHLCNAYADNFGITTVTLRYFTVYGPRQRPDMAIHRMIEAARHGTKFPLYGDGSQLREFTFVDDIVAATVEVAKRDVGSGALFNVSGGSEVTILELADLVGAVVGRPLDLERRPSEPGDLMRNGGDTARIRSAVGWEPRMTLREGLAAQAAWHEHGESS